MRSLQARVDVAHPAIPTVFAVIPDGRKTWLVGEFVKGLPLSELVDELSPESIYLIARDLLSALGCLERLGLVHGDLSPNNVVVDVNGQVRLLDFESCSRVGQPLSDSATIGFSAPERYSRRVSLPTIDTWSVGALIIWLITQAAPSMSVATAPICYRTCSIWRSLRAVSIPIFAPLPRIFSTNSSSATVGWSH